MKTTQLNKAIAPTPALQGPHPEVKAMLTAIKRSKAEWGLSFAFAKPRIAKNRLESWGEQTG